MSQTPNFLCLPADELNSVMDAVGARWDRLRGQRLLLTGGTGFIGKWLLGTFLHANRELSLGAEVTILSRHPDSFFTQFPELRGMQGFSWLAGDVRELAVTDADDYAFAIHAATDVVASSTPLDILDTCITGTRRVLDVMSAGKAARRVLLLSSGAIYGRTPPEVSVIPESWSGAPSPLSPASAYGEGKRVSELLGAMAIAARPGLEVSIARCFAFVGPHLPLDKHFAIGNFIRAAMRDEVIQIQGDGTPLRSYLYASDLAYWLWVMLFDAPSGRAYNVGGTEAISISELAYRVNRVLGSTGGVHVALQHKPSVAPQTYVPSVERIANELGLKPRVQLDEAILLTARWAGYTLPRN